MVAGNGNSKSGTKSGTTVALASDRRDRKSDVRYEILVPLLVPPCTGIWYLCVQLSAKHLTHVSHLLCVAYELFCVLVQACAKVQKTDSKSAEGNLMGVRFPLPAPTSLMQIILDPDGFRAVVACHPPTGFVHGAGSAGIARRGPWWPLMFLGL